MFRSALEVHGVRVVVVGGGGLVQSIKQSRTKSGWRLPFTPAILDMLRSVPIVVYGVGLSHFRDKSNNYPKIARDSMR